MRIRTAFAVIGLIAMPAALAADALVRAGRWEITAQMDFQGRQLPPGMPGTKPMTSIACFTEEEIRKGNRPIPLPADDACKLSNYKANGKKISFTMNCEESTMMFDATIHSPESYSGTFASHGKDPSQKMTVKFTGKRAGDACSAAELAEDAEDDGTE